MDTKGGTSKFFDSLSNKIWGIASNIKDSQIEKMKDNSFKINWFSKPIAQSNYDPFQEKIDQKLEQWQKSLIKKKEIDEVPLIDTMGRNSFYYCELGGKNIIIY